MGDGSIINLKEFNSCVTKINKWYLRQSKLLTIVTSPYNSTLIYSSIINQVVKEKKRVLYIWGMNKVNDELIDNIKLLNKHVTYSYLEKGENEVNITFVNFKNIYKISGHYDLCLIDDISMFSYVNKDELIEIIEDRYLYSTRIILYTIEKLVSMGVSIEVAALNSRVPFVEPRILNTRIKLEEDIPYVLYDYLNWFKYNKKKVVILVPSEEKANKVYGHYTKNLKMKDIKIVKNLKGEIEKKIDSIVKRKSDSIFIITNYAGEYLSKIDNKDIIVLFADELVYGYKKIIFLCGEVGKDGEKSGEVLLVSKEISKDMEKAKKISRDFNKVIWEKGLLKH